MRNREKSASLDSLALMVQRGFEHVDQRFEHVTTQFSEVHGKLDRLEKGQQTLFAAVKELPSPEAFQKLRAKVSDLDARLSRLEHKR